MSSAGTFSIQYEFKADTFPEAEQTATEIALEQTAELPIDAIPPELQHLTGTVSGLKQITDSRYSCSIAYSSDLAGDDILQFLNVMFGNVSIKPNIKITDIDPGSLASLFPGPAFGIEGIRDLASAYKRPLSCTALKPVGSTPETLAGIAYESALGGIDIIKDDHGLANQSMAGFESRVESCVSAIKKAEQTTGKKTLYFPNITARFELLKQRAEFALECGADGLLISPQLTGLAALTSLARSSVQLPIMAHPAFSGPYTIHSLSGIAPDVYFGKLWRALGADAVIYPNAGGRFSYTLEQCLSINNACRGEFASFKQAFPVPGGGIDRKTIADWKDRHGNDTIFLIGGSLYLHPGGMQKAAEQFQRSLEEN